MNSSIVWRVYFTDIPPTGIGPQHQPGGFSASSPMACYPKVYNIEMDPHEDLIVGRFFSWLVAPVYKAIAECKETLRKYPNHQGANLTKF